MKNDKVEQLPIERSYSSADRREASKNHPLNKMAKYNISAIKRQHN